MLKYGYKIKYLDYLIKSGGGIGPMKPSNLFIGANSCRTKFLEDEV